jgi:hypothetical protein
MGKKLIRSYYSLVRSKQADKTRARIAAAARKLILSRGFEAATVGDIGPVFQKLKDEAETVTDPVARLRLTARIVREVCDGERAEVELLRKARVVFPEIEARHDEVECGRHEAQCATVKLLLRCGRLKTGVGPQEARDLLWTFTSRDVYRILVVERGWSSDHYERWLGDTLVAQLAEPEGSELARVRLRGTLGGKPSVRRALAR